MASPETSNVEATSDSILPSGSRLLTSFPDFFMLPELVFGGLVWILVASTDVHDKDSQGWVMFVSILLFALTLLLMICYFIGWPRNSTAWCLLDAAYHGISAVLYFSVAVLQANTTIRRQSFPDNLYKIDIAASVFAFAATVVYVVHATYSFKRWKTV